MIITWIPVGSKKQAIRYRQPEIDKLQINDANILDFTEKEDGVFEVPDGFATYVLRAERKDGVLCLDLLYRCDGSLREPEPIDYGEKERIEWVR